MKMSAADWESLHGHVSTLQGGAPRAVYASVAALAAGEAITASWSHMDVSSEENTVWTNWFVTDHLLGCSAITFQARFYDNSEEQEVRTASHEVNSAWVRPLAHIALFEIGTVGEVVKQGSDWWSLTAGIAVEFIGGQRISLPDPGRLYQPADRERWDTFVAAVRSGILLRNHAF